MTPQDQEALLTIAFLAAFADGNNSGREREELKRVAASLGGELNSAALYQAVLLKKVSIADAAAKLSSAETRRLAYELAVGVIDADGRQDDAEKAFLAQLAPALGIDADTAGAFAREADHLAAAPVSGQSSFEPKLASTQSTAESDAMILNYAIMNGALELLPDRMASMAIIPLQMRMVYRIGKAHGFELDRGHIKDFLATAGIGLASQYVERLGVGLIGRVFGGGLIGGLIGGLAKQAVSSGFSFATTYALGHLARRYYAGGRTFSTEVLKDTYQSLLGEARSMEGQYLPAIREKARTINVQQVLKEVSG